MQNSNNKINLVITNLINKYIKNSSDNNKTNQILIIGNNIDNLCQEISISIKSSTKLINIDQYSYISEDNNLENIDFIIFYFLDYESRDKANLFLLESRRVIDDIGRVIIIDKKNKLIVNSCLIPFLNEDMYFSHLNIGNENVGLDNDFKLMVLMPIKENEYCSLWNKSINEMILIMKLLQKNSIND